MFNDYVYDIVIPIYNAFDDLIQCINSIYENTLNERFNLILINDNSSDMRIKKYLNSLCSNKKNVIIINNEENLGFVKSINIGMKYSNNDVVILNSDTIVTFKWLNKIISCAYSDDLIATVTPLTNDGTICSVPNFCTHNSIPENFNLDSYAKLIEKISFKSYPAVPTGVGFCMYIKRKVLNQIGLLDEESFNKGYGEENDFCCRAIEYGYVNVICDNTFIYHKGSKSFGSKKNKYIEENSIKLRNKYPFYFNEVDKFIRTNPLRDIQENIKNYISIKNNKRNVLYLMSVKLEDYHEYIETLPLDINKFFITSNGRELLLTVYSNKYVKKFNFKLECFIRPSTYFEKSYREILEQIILMFDIDFIHVYDLKFHTFDISEIAKKYSIPLYITIHDYYLLCPDTKKEFDIRNYPITKDISSEIIYKDLGYSKNFLNIWKSKVREHLKNYDKIFFPSHKLAEIFDGFIELSDSNYLIEDKTQKVYKYISHVNRDVTRLSENVVNGKFKPYLIYNAMLRDENNYAHQTERFFDIYIDKVMDKIEKKFYLDINYDFICNMKKSIIVLLNDYSNKKIRYVIWGASNSGKITKTIFENILPNFELIGFIDKFKSGKFENIDIYNPQNLNRLNYDYIVIATTAGKAEAENVLISEGKEYGKNYTFGYGVI
ncbi:MULTISPECIES: glycosyltransferase family 2 protein [Clostridium]|uniref:glycosyltransferase family 2 protein n=1 Tax=Clostridium TaxID=1485 RepID=UPI000826B763|nr:MULTISPECIES: glycosyltransferase family 2 protein [Clostridium]